MREFGGKDNLGYDVDLSHVLNMMGLAEKEVQVSEIMSTYRGLLCYSYSKVI